MRTLILAFLLVGCGGHVEREGTRGQNPMPDPGVVHPDHLPPGASPTAPVSPTGPVIPHASGPATLCGDVDSPTTCPPDLGTPPDLQQCKGTLAALPNGEKCDIGGIQTWNDQCCSGRCFEGTPPGEQGRKWFCCDNADPNFPCQ